MNSLILVISACKWIIKVCTTMCLALWAVLVHAEDY